MISVFRENSGLPLETPFNMGFLVIAEVGGITKVKVKSSDLSKYASGAGDFLSYLTLRY